MNSHESAHWPAKKERAALMLAGGSTIGAVSRELKIGRRTLYDWIEDPKYKLLISRFRRRMLDRSVGMLSKATNKAVARLEKLVGSDDESVSLRAAVSLLDHAIRLREHCELAERLATLEVSYAGGFAGAARKNGTAYPPANGRG
jgi:hypothetical protein